MYGRDMGDTRPRLPFGTTGNRYVLSLLVLAVTLAFRRILNPVLATSFPDTVLVIIMVPTAFSAWFMGFGPGVLTAALGLIVADYFFIPPFHAMSVFSVSQLPATITYILAAAVLLGMGRANRRATLRYRQAQEALSRSHAELEERIRERTAEVEQRNLQIQTQAQMLEVSNQGLRELSARLLRTQDEERRRIARELHDDTGQALTGLTMALSALGREAKLSSPELAKGIAESVELARQINNDLRTMSYLLHPPLLDEMGLASALRWYVEGFRQRANIDVRLELPDKPARLQRDLETAIFRTVQECLTNIHRHSESPTAVIHLGQMPDKIVLEVADQGKGITPQRLSEIASQGAPGVGLRGMQERVKDFGGKLEIFSARTGTTIRIMVPLSSADLARAQTAS